MGRTAVQVDKRYNLFYMGHDWEGKKNLNQINGETGKTLEIKKTESVDAET